jgi:outer membrane protein OmpA-like peptidoglycan-associated protein
MWAVSPEGRAVNLGEVLLNGTKSKLNVTTDLQAFGLIVTAEPYFAVTQPSDVVVMENFVRPETKGKFETIDAKYELLQRGQYTFNVDRSRVRAVDIRDKNMPIELYEARNAVQIAQWAGADKYAADSFNKAANLLRQSEDYIARKQKKSAEMTARQAVQTAEDSRIIALRRIEQERLEKERQASADRENAARLQAETARSQAEEAARQRAQAEEQQRLSAQQALQAQQQATAAQQQAAASAEQARLESERRAQEAQRRAEAEQAAQRAEAERLAADKAKAEAVAAQQEAARQRADAEAARQAALQQQQQAQQEAERARTAAAEADRMRLQAESDKEHLRQQLLQQFNMILQTRDTARGLIVNMSDVLFDTGKYTLRPGAREKLARVSGIILSHPGLKIEVEGHTDSVGSDAYNQTLSENRANTVRQYLVSNGIDPSNVTAKGFGETTPVASNDTAAGRQQNRRVELVVSGEIIGTKVSEIRTMGVTGNTTGTTTTQPPPR